MSLIRELVFRIPIVQLEIWFSNIGASFLSTTSRECWSGCSESYVQLPTVRSFHLEQSLRVKLGVVTRGSLGSSRGVGLGKIRIHRWLMLLGCFRSRCLTSTRPQDSDTTWLRWGLLDTKIALKRRKIDPGIQNILKRKAVVYAHCSHGHSMQPSDRQWSLVAELHFVWSSQW